MPAAPTFLIVDDDADERRRFVATLLRHFPDATLHECESEEIALEIVRTEKLTAIIGNRARDIASLPLVWELRDLDAYVPIIMVSDGDRWEMAQAAGANRYLHCDESSRLGSIVEEVL